MWIAEPNLRNLQRRQADNLKSDSELVIDANLPSLRRDALQLFQISARCGEIVQTERRIQLLQTTPGALRQFVGDAANAVTCEEARRAVIGKARDWHVRMYRIMVHDVKRHLRSLTGAAGGFR